VEAVFRLHERKGEWTVVANSENTYGPRELSEAELELVGGGIDWVGVFKTAVSAVYTAVGAEVGGAVGAFVGKVVGDVVAQAAVDGAAYGNPNPSLMM
jgi:hypothetical protein